MNLKGRERLGSLDPSEAENFLRWLKHELSQIRVATSNHPLVANIIDVRQQCLGPRAEFLPDLALTWAPNKPETQIYSPTIGKVRARLTTGRGGNHTPDSFALLWGAIAGDPVAS